MKLVGIYRITNLSSGRSYVGQSVHIEKRWSQHLKDAFKGGKKSAICDALRAYGAEAFAFVLLEQCNEAELNAREAHWIATLDSLRNGYNLIAGGGQNRELSSVTRERMCNAQLGKKLSDEHKAKISSAGKGRKPSSAQIEALRLRATGRVVSAETRAKISASKKGCEAHNKGKKGPPHSEAAKSAMSLRRKGAHKSPEHRAKLQAALAIARAVRWARETA